MTRHCASPVTFGSKKETKQSQPRGSWSLEGTGSQNAIFTNFSGCPALETPRGLARVGFRGPPCHPDRSRRRSGGISLPNRLRDFSAPAPAAPLPPVEMTARAGRRPLSEWPAVRRQKCHVCHSGQGCSLRRQERRLLCPLLASPRKRWEGRLFRGISAARRGGSAFSRWRAAAAAA